MLITEVEYSFPNGEKAVIRSATIEDAEALKNLREVTSEETHFMARCPEDGPMNIENIKNGIHSMISSDINFMVTAFKGNEIIGDLGISVVRPHLKYMHRGYLGMAIRQKYTGLGLGTFMMAQALNQAKANGFEQIELDVYADNERAQHLYKKMGFVECGRIPNAFKLPDGTYIDEILMVNTLI